MGTPACRGHRASWAPAPRTLGLGTGLLALARSTESPEGEIACAWEGAEETAMEENAAGTPATKTTDRRLVMIPRFSCRQLR